MAKSEKRNQKGPPKVRGWLRHLPRLETPEQGTGAALNKYGVFFPYKHQFFDLVPSGLWLYNPHLCWCGSKMLNTISMGWFQGNSWEQRKNETQFYHLTTWSRHKFSQKHPLTPSISHIPCPSPGASCWTHLSRGTGRWFRFSPKSEGKGHTLLLWGMPKPWGITCLEFWWVLQSTGEAPFSEEHLWAQSYPMSACISAALASAPPSEGGLSSRAEIQLQAAEQSCLCPSRTAHPPGTPWTSQLWDTQTPSTILLKVGTAQQWLQDSRANLRQRQSACCSSKKQDLVFLLSKPDQKLCIYTEIKSPALHLPNWGSQSLTSSLNFICLTPISKGKPEYSCCCLVTRLILKYKKLLAQSTHHSRGAHQHPGNQGCISLTLHKALPMHVLQS